MTELLPRRRWSDDVYARLVELLEHPPTASPVAVFDWDDTTLEGDLSLAVLRFLDAENGTDWHGDYWRMLAEGGRELAYPQPTRWFAGHTPEGLEALADRVVSSLLSTGGVAFRPEMADLIRGLSERGWQIWVVTASPKVFVARMARELDLAPEHILGMRLQLGPDGRYTREIDGIETWGTGKARIVRARIGDQLDLCAGDSRSDAPMMVMSRHALLIDGHDADLRAEARERGWMIQSGWPHSPPEPMVRRDDAPETSP